MTINAPPSPPVAAAANPCGFKSNEKRKTPLTSLVLPVHIHLAFELLGKFAPLIANPLGVLVKEPNVCSVAPPQYDVSKDLFFQLASNILFEVFDLQLLLLPND